MSRVKDTMSAIEGIRELSDIDGVTEEVKIALLGHIALALAVIADKMTEKDEVNS